MTLEPVPIEKGELLWEASTRGDAEMVQNLLQDPLTDVNWADQEFKRTSLYRACGHGHLHVVKLLLEDPRTDVNLAQCQGVSPFYIACCEGYDGIVDLMIKHPRVNVSQTRDTKSTPFSSACERGHAKVVRLLLQDQRIDVNQANQSRTSPLWFASQEGHLEVVKLLLASDRAIETITRTLPGGKLWSDSDAMEQAIRNNHFDIAQLIRRFQQNQAQLQFELRKEFGILDQNAANLFATTVFLCDDYLSFQNETGDEDEDEKRSLKFFQMATKLPMELQMLLSNRVFGLGKSSITISSTEKALRKVAHSF